MMGRTCFWSTDGSVSLGPTETKPGDIVVAIPRCPTPYMLRPESGTSKTSWFRRLAISKDKIADERRYTLIGDCYVHGFKSDTVFEGKYKMHTLRIA
jgi:hypothetical protein